MGGPFLTLVSCLALFLPHRAYTLDAWEAQKRLDQLHEREGEGEGLTLEQYRLHRRNTHLRGSDHHLSDIERQRQGASRRDTKDPLSCLGPPRILRLFPGDSFTGRWAMPCAGQPRAVEACSYEIRLKLQGAGILTATTSPKGLFLMSVTREDNVEVLQPTTRMLNGVVAGGQNKLVLRPLTSPRICFVLKLTFEKYEGNIDWDAVNA